MSAIKRVVKLVAGGVGVARESYLEHQEGKAKTIQSGSSSTSRNLEHDTNVQSQNTEGDYRLDEPSSQNVERTAKHTQVKTDGEMAVFQEEDDATPLDRNDGPHDLEKIWATDEAITQVDSASDEEMSSQDTQSDDATKNRKLVAEVLNIAPAVTTRLQSLSLPVIIPQRRPKTKARGFVRAYAPCLDNSALNQDTFLTFLKNFHTASKASKSLSVVLLAANVTGFVPSLTAQIVSAALNFTTAMAIKAQQRYRANIFLQEMNEKLFIPRGLFALVVAYRPDDIKNIEVGEFDPAQSIAKYADNASSAWRRQASNLRANSGMNHGALEVGGCAELVYPSIEETQRGEATEQQGTWKKMGKFVVDYRDKRAQATYQGENPDTALSAGPAPQFRSRYADPNHPANSGSIVSLVTGGKVNPPPLGSRRESARSGLDSRRGAGLALGRDNGRGLGRDNGRALSRGAGQRGTARGPGFIKQALVEDVMYLMIVNMPSDEELAKVRNL